MYKVKVPVPSNVEIERFFDIQEIILNDAEKSFFPPNPDNVSTNNNYTSNPLPGEYYHVILGISIQCTLRGIRSTADIDPLKVLNALSDATFKFSTNQGRNTDIEHRLKDYLNLNDIKVALTSAASDDGITSEITIPTTGIRQTDNLYFLKPNESFTVKTLFQNKDWPTAAHWTTAGLGRFGLEVSMSAAKMTEDQFTAYQAKVQAV